MGRINGNGYHSVRHIRRFTECDFFVDADPIHFLGEIVAECLLVQTRMTFQLKKVDATTYRNDGDMEPPVKGGSQYPTVSGVDIAMLLAGYSSAEPVSSSGYNAKLTIFT